MALFSIRFETLFSQSSKSTQFSYTNQPLVQNKKAAIRNTNKNHGLQKIQINTKMNLKENLKNEIRRLRDCDHIPTNFISN